jgi:nitroreductase
MNTLKKAKTSYPVTELITDRWSARSFSDRPISEEDMHTLLEAGSWAFSAGNGQPWGVIYGHRGSDHFNKILQALDGGNAVWAQHAAILMSSIAKITHERDGQPYHNPYAEHDLGAFNATLTLQATAMQLSAHPMAGFNKERISEAFELDASLKPMVVFAIGHVDSPEKLGEPFKTRELTPRTRKALSEIILR